MTPAGKGLAARRARKARTWIRDALDDLQAAQQMFVESSVFQTHQACFFAQQAAEKALKAALIHDGVPFERDHDLDRLADLLPDGWQARAFVGQLRSLSRYSVETRYPDEGDLARPSRDDAATAIKQ